MKLGEISPNHYEILEIGVVLSQFSAKEIDFYTEEIFDRNCLLTAISVILSVPRRAQLARWLLTQHVWPTMSGRFKHAKGCQGRSVMGLI